MRRSAVCGIIVDDLILLLRRDKYDNVAPGKWCLPGGKFDEGLDKTDEDCALRELKEETTIVTHDIKFANTVVSMNKKYLIYVFFKDLCDRPNVLLSDEHDKYDWFELDSLDPEILAGNTMQLIDEIKNKYYYNEN